MILEFTDIEKPKIKEKSNLQLLSGNDVPDIKMEVPPERDVGVSDTDPLVPADPLERGDRGEHCEVRGLGVVGGGHVVGVCHGGTEVALDMQLVGVAGGHGVQDDLDLGPVEADSQKGDGGGHVDVLGEYLDGLPGGTGVHDGLLLHGVHVDSLVDEVLDTG